MTVKYVLSDEDGTKAWITSGGNLKVLTTNIPPNGTPMIQEPFREFFKNSSDSSDMLVNGSSTAVDFNISSDPNLDKYVKTIAFELTDVGNGDLNEFGNIGSALTNGVQILLKRDEEDIEFHEGIKTNYQLVQAGGFRPSFGSTGNTFRASNVNGSSEGWSSFIDLGEIYGLHNGVRIPTGTSQTFTVRIRDNLSSGITSFNCVATGFKRLDEREMKTV